MIFAVNPVNNNNTISSVTKATKALLEKYNQSQSESRVASVVVYQSLSYLTDSYGKGLTQSALKDLQQTFKNENLQDTSAFELVDNMIADFNVFSSDGEVITESDFMNIVSFADAQNFMSNASYDDLNSILKQIGSSVSSSVASQYGQNTALTLAFMNFMNSLSDENINSMLSSSNNASSKQTQNSQKSDNTTSAMSNASSFRKSPYAANPIQDYRTVTPAQLKSPINIAV